MSSFLCLVIIPEYFVIRLYQSALSGQVILQSVYFCSIFLSPAHIFTQAFNRVPVIDAFVQTYPYGLYQCILVISGNYAQDHLQIIPVITFLPPFQIIHPHGHLPVARHMDKDAFGYLHSGVSRFSVGVVINGPSLSGTERMPADEFPRILVVQLHIPFRFLQPDGCLPAPVSSAWQAVIIPPVLHCIVLAYMVFPHLLLRWLWRPMIGHEKAFLHGKLFPGNKTGGPVHLPVPRPFKPFEGLPVQTVPA